MKHFFIAVCLLQYIVITNLQAHTIKKIRTRGRTFQQLRGRYSGR